MKKCVLLIFFIIALSIKGQVPEKPSRAYGYNKLPKNQVVQGNFSKYNRTPFSSLEENGKIMMELDTTKNKFYINSTDSLRRYYYTIGVGLFELFQAGIGYQIDSKYAISIKYAWTFLAYGGGFYVPGGGAGWGMAVNYFKNFGVFNNVRFEGLYYTDLPLLYYNQTFNKNHGFYFQIDLAQENILKSEKFIEFYWYVGVGGNILRREKSFIFPTIGIGFLKNR